MRVKRKKYVLKEYYCLPWASKIFIKHNIPNLTITYFTEKDNTATLELKIKEDD